MEKVPNTRSTTSRGKKYTILSIVISLALFFIGIIFNNIAYPFQLNSLKYTVFEAINSRFQIRTDNKTIDEAVFVNVSYDKVLIADTVKFDDDTNRRKVITDRALLTDFLHRIENLNYKYLFIDIRFEGEDRSINDSALVEQMLRMRDIAIDRHWDKKNTHPFPLIDDKLDSIAYYCDFIESKSSAGFFKYKYLQNDENSVALEMYERFTGRTIRQHKLFYLDGCKVCQNSNFLIIHTDMGEERLPEHNIFDMGSDIVRDTASMIQQLLPEIVSGKYVIVGDMLEDMHDTYVHAQPGAYLHYLAFQSLLNKKHIVRWWYATILLIAYFIISRFIYRPLIPEECRWFSHNANKIIQRIKATARKSKLLRCVYRIFKLTDKVKIFPMLHFVSSFITYGLILLILSAVLYFVFDTAYNIFVPSFFFSLQSRYVQTKKL